MQDNIPKQRGIYSEILTTEDTDNLKLVSTIGPSKANLIVSNAIQKVPRARGITKKQVEAKALVDADLEELQEIKIVGKNYFRNPNVNQGFYSKKREGVADPDPKVMEPFLPIPGKPPRKVVIDRQRKLFASLEIEELLLELGIDYRDPQPNQADWLPLEPFDDLEYDCRLPEEWIELGVDHDGNFAPIPAQGLFKNDDGSCEWKAVLIESYDDQRAIYLGQWDMTGEYVELTRINLLFNSEDPRIFAQRVAQAHQERIYADSQIRYNFFIDNMPTDELAELDPEQISRIVHMATASRYLKSRQNVDTTEIMYQVTQDFARTMNKIIMEKTLEKNAMEIQDMIPANLTLPEKTPPKETPYFAMVPIPQHEFAEQFSNFCFQSLYIKEEAITAMVAIRTECNKLLQDNKIFNIQNQKTLRVDEFKQIQSSSIAALSHSAGEQGWVGTLAKIVKTSFDNVGKGWFNIHETSKETYEFGKLKKFLTLVNFMMQDTVLTMCKESVYQFVEHILRFCPVSTEIVSTREAKNVFAKKALQPEDSDYEEKPYQDVSPADRNEYQSTIVWLHGLYDKDKDPEPLFVLDLILKQGQLIPAYSTPPEQVVAKIMAVFDEGVECLQQIPQLEPILLRHLFKTHGKKTVKAPLRPRRKPTPVDPMKKSVLPDENTWLWDAGDALETALKESIKPLQEYLQTFAEFEQENKLDPVKYVKSLADRDEPVTADALKADIHRHRQLETELKERIPEAVTVSIFTVNIKDIRNMYTGKYQQIINQEIKLIAARAVEKNYEIHNKFKEIDERVQRPPANIEELTETKRYISDIGIAIEKLKKEIDECMSTYDICGEFNYEFSKTENDDKWKLFAAPLKLVKTIETQAQVLEKRKEQFIKDMEQEQAEFEETLDSLGVTVGGFAAYDDLTKYAEIAVNVESVNERLQDCLEKSRLFNSREFVVGKEQKDYSRLQVCIKDFKPYSDLWLNTRTWFSRHAAWTTGPWEELDPEELDAVFEQCNKAINGALRYFKDKDFPKITTNAGTMKAKIDEFKPVVPVAVALRKQGMQERHWQELSKAVGFDIRPDADFTLTTVVEKGMLKHTELCEDVGEKAAKEFHIEKSLAKMQADWEGCDFLLPQFKQTTTCYISGFDEAYQMLDEHIVTTQAMSFSPFKKPFEQQIEAWLGKLLLVSNTLEEWIKCQGQWMYLQPIFDSPDIMKQLPQETKRFKSVDSTWRQQITLAKALPNILFVCSKEGLKDRFEEANKNLELVQKGLADYLEKKRSVFARFYFLSNDELLEILSQTKEVRNVRPHLRKVFEAIADLEFKEDDTMVAMISAEGEQVNFIRKIDPKDRNVEYWMGDVEKMMTASVRHVLLHSVKDYLERPRTEWVKLHPGMCVLNGSQVHWTSDVSQAIAEKGKAGVKEYYDFLARQLTDSVVLVRQKLTKQAMLTLNALIVIDVHAKDVVLTLVRNEVEDVGAFEWISQLRYYWEEDDCYVKCVQTSFPYGYEYLGNSMRLVITPLTDKCYMTLMGALSLDLGGAPAGPAGTGKTESTKDLAKALAKQCVVFNCSDGMDHLMVAKFFKGLASAGAWACFDEFNRINIEVLSVIAQQLLILFGAKSGGQAEITFEESLIKMKPTFCVFITMNPGYAGRSELPDNLKALFRPVAMMVPDYALIGEIKLYSFGFLEGRALAKKMVTTFKLASESLSSQDHYDYGMRAVTSVINAAGLLKPEFPDMNEQLLLLRALRDVNVPKFLKDDIPLFENIILDLFPGLKKPDVDYGDLTTQIEKTCKLFNVQTVELFIQKIMQLYDTIQVRHGLMIVGPTGGGKSSNWRVLQHAISQLSHQERFEKVHVDCLNPKSITMGQLYGYVDPQTTEWVDGVLAKLVLECTKDESPDKHWVMFDGPVDAIWIENMNTVLDDNKKLCLNSGQIITLTPRMTMMFEVEDLAVASPATVSRCGMVYMEPVSIGLPPYFTSWLNTLPPKVAANPAVRAKLQEVGDALIEEACWFLRHDVTEPVVTCDNNVVQSLFRMMDAYLSDYVENEVKKVPPEKVEDLLTMIPQLFLFSLIWSIGTTTTLPGREKFDTWIRGRLPKLGIEFPEDKLVYDYWFDRTTKKWVGWRDTINEYVVDTKVSYNEILVPTLDSIRMKYLMALLLKSGKHVLTPGPTGTGKSVNTAEMLTYELPEEYQTLVMTFSAQTSANQTQDYLDDKFEKRRKGVFGPPVGKKFVIFVDDLNMPKKEEYGAQPPLELLRQFMDHGGWYDRKTKEKPFCKIEDIVFVAAMGPPGGGRAVITPRLQRHFNIMTYTDVQYESIETIFTTIIKAFYQPFAQEVRDAVAPIVQATITIYDQVLNGPLKPTPNKSHYTFNLRDISRISQGLCIADRRSTTEAVQVVRLWIHESKRVFGDRLIDEADRNWLDAQLRDTGCAAFNLAPEIVFNSKRLIFGDFMDGIEAETRLYNQIVDVTVLNQKIIDYLEDYNATVKVQMKLVMFLDACDHVARITRVLRQPLGNALLLGVGGSGRQSLSRLATFIANYRLFQIEVVKGYGMLNWRDDVKKVLMLAGVENRSTSFLFVDTQIVNEQMLEDINNVLNSGDVPNLYKNEDLEPIFKVGKLICMEKNLQVTKMNMFQSYLGQVKRNIHMIIAMSPLGEIFRSRLRRFPSLVNCCTIDWFSEWPEEALLGVGRGQIVAEDLALDSSLDPCVRMFTAIHQSVERKSRQFKDQLNRSNYVTPTSFLELLAAYASILRTKRKANNFSKTRLVNGLEVLKQAGVEISALNDQITQMAPKLEITKKDVAATMAQLAVDKADADAEKEIVARDEAEASQQEAEASALKEDAAGDLAKAEPLLKEAAKVLSELKKDDLVFLGSINKPTATVVLGMELSCHMFSIKPQKDLKKIDGDTGGYFATAKAKLLNNAAQFLKSMQDYDKENIPDNTVKKVNEILKSEDFGLDKVKSASMALVAIQKWSSAMMDYYELLKIVNPKRAKVAEMNAKLAVVRASLAAKRKKLKEVEEKIDGLERMFAEKQAYMASLQAEIDNCNKKLSRADKIIAGLAGEKTRWTETVARLTNDYKFLIGNCLVAAGMLAYSGAFTAQFRLELEAEWRTQIAALGLELLPNVSMIALLEDKVTTKLWSAASLPGDNLSIENAIIMFGSRRWPLMIDPQNQANKFIKLFGREAAEAGLEVFKMSDGNLLRGLEVAIQYGKWTLIENVGEDLDPALEPILLKQVDKGVLRLGEKSIPYDPRFKFLMTTTLPNPHYSPETSVKVTILNFAITPFGLEEQMLNRFVGQEMPELQKKKDNIVQQNAQAAKTLNDIEDSILSGLTKNEKIADILEDDELILILEESKRTSDEIKVRMAESEITEKEIDKTREAFRPVSFRASVLFFTIIDLAVIDPMYQYSLQWFANLFGASIDNSAKSSDVQTRIKNLNDHFTLALYENVCRSLFEKHKLLFSLILTAKILFGAKALDPAEWRYFLAGPSGKIDVVKNPTDWLGDLEWAEAYKQFHGMSQLPSLKGIEKAFVKLHKDFQKIFDSSEPQNLPLPGEWNDKLDLLQKLIVLKALRPDKVPLAVQNFITKKLGQKFIEPPTFNISKSFKDSSILIPLIFVLSAGSDPVADFKRFADEMNMGKKYQAISLGRGQDKKAENCIVDMAGRGGWALLMNCHLATSFMPKLERIVENLDDSNHRDFRLWMTSMPSPTFPVSVLQNSVKMTLEPPSGLKQNVLGTYEALDFKEIEESPKAGPIKRLLFGFCFFHAIVQDRRKFGPIGWNIPYAFTNEDLMVCRKQLKIFVEDYEEIPYKVLNYVGAEVNYGGRVTDDKDGRLIITILGTYMCEGMMTDGYKLSESGAYRSISPGDKDDYLDYIRTLPLNPEPEAFGLHANAEITTSMNETIVLLENVLSMQPRASTGAGKTREQIIGDMAKSLQERTPPVFDLETVSEAYPTSYEESMNTVLFQECVRYNRLLSIMASSLKLVQKALVGEVVMSEDLEKMSDAIFDNQVPPNWAEKGFLSLKPLASWIEDCNARIKFLVDWINNGIPSTYWISGFFFPQAFLTGTLQNYARKETIAVDKLSFDFVYMDTMKYTDVSEKPTSGVVCYGLYLEGCKWNLATHKLDHSDPKKLFVDLPLLHLVPRSEREEPQSGIYKCPAYKVLSRTGTLSTTGHSTNFVMWLELPSDLPEEVWIKAGVALFLALRF